MIHALLGVLASVALLSNLQEDPEAKKKAVQARTNELRKSLGSPDESAQEKALTELGEVEDDEAIPLLAGKLSHGADGLRIAAARAIARHRKPASVKALANAIGANAARPEVLKAFIESLETLDLCASIPVLLALADLNKNAFGEAALKAIGKIGCGEYAPALVSMLQRAEVEEKKPDIFEGTDDAPESENRQKNKALAALAPALRELLTTVTGKTFGSSREWAAAFAGGRVLPKRTAVYFCALKEKTFEVPAGQSKKCPYADGKTLHEDCFFKHLRD